MDIFLFLVVASLFLAYTNGANDNFKGVATLFGSGTTDYKQALGLATVATFAGSISSIFLAEKLVKNFSGKGLVPDHVASSPDFLLAVALGAGLTVLLATLRGFPISTTHSLVGALVGSGFAAVGMATNFAQLGKTFFLPLLASPLIALTLGAILYYIFTRARKKMGIEKDACLCITNSATPIQPQSSGSLAFTAGNSSKIKTQVTVGHNCQENYAGTISGLSAHTLLNAGHFISAGALSFARGLNDTPKIVALLTVVSAFNLQAGMLSIATAIALGGIISARKTAETMSHKITKLNHGQGFTANLAASILILFASRFGVPVSTTHVSSGALFGIGLSTRQSNNAVIREIILAWLLTLPVAAVCGALVYFLLQFIKN